MKRYRLPGRILSLSAAAILTFTPLPPGEAADHADLGKIIKFLPPQGSPEMYGTIVMRARTKKAGMAPAVFAHWSHRARYACKVCHQDLEFSMRSGGTGITRDSYLSGRYCGACHDGKTAFSVKDGPQRHCDRCHRKGTAWLKDAFTTFAANLPSAEFGNRIDWNAALKDKKINQIFTLSPTERPPETPAALRKPLILGADNPRSAVTFSHDDHYLEMDCSSCHPEIFNIKNKGTVHFSMDKNLYSMYCGACHLKVAFPMNDCRRCHPGMSNKSGGF